MHERGDLSVHQYKQPADNARIAVVQWGVWYIQISPQSSCHRHNRLYALSVNRPPCSPPYDTPPYDTLRYAMSTAYTHGRQLSSSHLENVCLCLPSKVTFNNNNNNSNLAAAERPCDCHAGQFWPNVTRRRYFIFKVARCRYQSKARMRLTISV